MWEGFRVSFLERKKRVLMGFRNLWCSFLFSRNMGNDGWGDNFCGGGPDRLARWIPRQKGIAGGK